VSVPVVLVFAALAVAPAAGFWCMAKVMDAFINWDREGVATRTQPSLAMLTADLHRLNAEYARVLHSDETFKVARLRALSAAYDETLTTCCAQYGLAAPGRLPMSGAERLQIEAELAQRGLNW
jgi:hypothetical protein